MWTQGSGILHRGSEEEKWLAGVAVLGNSEWDRVIVVWPCEFFFPAVAADEQRFHRSEPISFCLTGKGLRLRASITIGGKKAEIAVAERETKRERDGRLARRPLKPAETCCATLCCSSIGSICYGSNQHQRGLHPPVRGGACLQPAADWIIKPALAKFEETND